MKCPVGFLWFVIFGLASQLGCDSASDESVAEIPYTSAPGLTASAGLKPRQFVLPKPRSFDPNPLRLPARTVSVAKGIRVYAVPQRVLEQARLGSTMPLRAASVEGVDGENIVVRAFSHVSYPIHPDYVVVPPQGPVRRRAPVLVSYRRKLRHAVATTVRRDRIRVRYTDLGVSLGERWLNPREVAPAPAGLAPGNYAVFRDSTGWSHVLLVSSAVHSDGKKRWLVLSYGAEARLVEHDKLRPMSPSFKPRPGNSVLVAFRGKMVPGRVKTADRFGIYTVRRRRMSSPLVVGFEMLLPAEHR